MQKLLTFFQQKISMYLPYFKMDILTSHKLTTLLSFEQLGPNCHKNGNLYTAPGNSYHMAF